MKLLPLQARLGSARSGGPNAGPLAFFLHQEGKLLRFDGAGDRLLAVGFKTSVFEIDDVRRQAVLKV